MVSASLTLLAQVDFSSATPMDWKELQGLGFILKVYGTLFVLGLLVDAVLAIAAVRDRDRWAQGVRRLQWRPWSWQDVRAVFGFLLVLFLLTVIGQLALRAAGTGLGRFPPAGFMILQSIFFHWAGLAFLYFLLARRRVGLKQAFGLRGGRLYRAVGLGVVLYLGTLPFIWFYSTLYHVALRAIGYEPTLQEVALAITEEASWPIQLYLWTLAIVVAPAFEELLFRGLALPVFTQRWGVGRGVLLTSFCFAAIHFHLPSVVPLFVIAVALSLAYIYTGTIVVPIVMHGLFNAVNLGMLMYLRYG